MINYTLYNIVVILCAIILCCVIIHTIIRYVMNVVANRQRKKEEEFFQRQYIDNGFKTHADDIRELRCKVVDNLYRIEKLEETLNKKETKKNVKKKKCN